MQVIGQIQHIVAGFAPIYHMLFFVWPPCLIFLLRKRHRLMVRLITLWTISGVVSVFMAMASVNPISLLPSLGPEPYNTVFLVSSRLAILVLLASLMVRPQAVLAQSK